MVTINWAWLRGPTVASPTSPKPRVSQACFDEDHLFWTQGLHLVPCLGGEELWSTCDVVPLAFPSWTLICGPAWKLLDRGWPSKRASRPAVPDEQVAPSNGVIHVGIASLFYTPHHVNASHPVCRAGSATLPKMQLLRPQILPCGRKLQMRLCRGCGEELRPSPESEHCYCVEKRVHSRGSLALGRFLPRVAGIYRVGRLFGPTAWPDEQTSHNV